MLNNTWLKAEFNRLLKTSRPSRKQRKFSHGGRNLRVESLEPRRLLSHGTPDLGAGDVFYEGFEHSESFVLHHDHNPASPVRAIWNDHGPNSFPDPNANFAAPQVRNGSAVPDGAGARVGNSVFESEAKKIANPVDWYREEVIALANGINTANKDYWYGFSTYFPQNFQPDYQFENYSQWREPGTGSGGPIFQLSTITDTASAPNNHDTLRFSSTFRGVITTIPLSEVKGKWTDWVVHANWSTSGSGVIEIYRDGQQIGSANGRNIEAANLVPKQRLGVYKGSWKFENQSPLAPAPTEMTVYYDEWRIARSDNGTNLFDVVDPAQGGSGNTSPTANNDTASTAINTQVTTVDVLANDTDPNQGDTLSVQSFTQPDNGSVADNGDGTFTYTPDLNFNGIDTFDYTVSDGNGGSDVGTVSVTVGVIAVQSFEFESLVPETASSGDAVETKADAAASGGEWVLYRSDEVGDFVTFTANVSQAGTYDIAMQSRLNAFRGQFQLSVDGTDVGGVNDSYATTPSFGELPALATGVNLTAGSHEFTFTVTGKNAASNDFQLSLDQLGLTLLEAGNGDFDTDGDTDGADFLQWQRGLGSVHDANDLIDWQNNYGNSSAVAAATAPEPKAAEITSPVFLLSPDLFSPVANQTAIFTVFDEAFADSGKASSATQQDRRFELVSDSSFSFTQEEVEEKGEGEAVVDSLDLAMELLDFHHVLT